MDGVWISPDRDWGSLARLDAALRAAEDRGCGTSETRRGHWPKGRTTGHFRLAGAGDRPGPAGAGRIPADLREAAADDAVGALRLACDRRCRLDEADVRYRCRTYREALPGAEIAYAGKAFLCRAMADWIGQEGLSLDMPGPLWAPG
jgi:hypothetical protein